MHLTGKTGRRPALTSLRWVHAISKPDGSVSLSVFMAIFINDCRFQKKVFVQQSLKDTPASVAGTNTMTHNTVVLSSGIEQ